MKKSRAVMLLSCFLLIGCTKPVNRAPVPDASTGTPIVVTEAVDVPVTEAVTPTESPRVTEDIAPTEPIKETLLERIAAIPDYSEDFIIEIPGFGFEDSEKAYERYSALDALGRCKTAEALLGKELMPTEPRGEIGMVKPSGWHTVRYDDLIEDKYLYNRCHLLGYQLTGENANVENLITGTRYFNVDGMEPYESMIAGYIRETGNHVYYRVTPVFKGDNLLCKGVWMEARSKEDDGAGINFSVFVYNIQPGIWIDYTTGDSCREEDRFAEKNYILNTRSKKFHAPDCKNVADIAAHNKNEYVGTREELIEDGYEPCGWCKP